jgi:hypothetical protein
LKLILSVCVVIAHVRKVKNISALGPRAEPERAINISHVINTTVVTSANRRLITTSSTMNSAHLTFGEIAIESTHLTHGSC